MSGSEPEATAVDYQNSLRILGLENGASVADIKKAYKKNALKWHPDKNLGNKEEATERFKKISSAYIFLTEPRELSFYELALNELDRYISLFYKLFGSCMPTYSYECDEFSKEESTPRDSFTPNYSKFCNPLTVSITQTGCRKRRGFSIS